MGLLTLYMVDASTNRQSTVCCRENVTLRDAFAIAGLDILRHIKVNGIEFRASQKLAECGIKQGGELHGIAALVVTHGRLL